MYNIGDKFYYDEDYKNKVAFCNQNSLQIITIGKDERGIIYQIQEPAKPTEEEILQALRERRNEECFSVINQNFIINGNSVPWFNTLTEEQKVDAENWLQQWKDVTVTKVIPIKPNWLK